MPEKRRKFDREFRKGSCPDRDRDRQAGRGHRPRAGHQRGTLGNWVVLDRQAREGTSGLSTGDIAELKRLRAENGELRMERHGLKRSVVLWVKEATK